MSPSDLALLPVSFRDSQVFPSSLSGTLCSRAVSRSLSLLSSPGSLCLRVLAPCSQRNLGTSPGASSGWWPPGLSLVWVSGGFRLFPVAVHSPAPVPSLGHAGCRTCPREWLWAQPGDTHGDSCSSCTRARHWKYPGSSSSLASAWRTFPSHPGVQGRTTRQMFRVKNSLFLLSALLKESQTGGEDPVCSAEDHLI